MRGRAVISSALSYSCFLLLSLSFMILRVSVKLVTKEALLANTTWLVLYD